jgi:hypothetical protein
MAGLLSQAATAAPVFYTDRTAFNAAVALLGGTPIVQDYELIDSDSWGTYVGTLDGDRYRYVLGGVDANSPDNFSATRDYTLSNTYLSTSFALSEVPGERYLTITLPNNVRAIGIDLLDYQSPDTIGTDPLSIAALGASAVLDGNPTPETPDFWGVVDADGVGNTLTISRTDEVLYPMAFDNVTYAIEIPEPVSAAILLTGLAALHRLRRRS